MYRFLQGLPAIVGIVGFFAYIWAGQSRIGGAVVHRIVDKLRQNPNLQIPDYATQTLAKISRLVESDVAVREAVNEGDRQLLRLLIILQHCLTVVVLVITAALVALSVWLMSLPDPLAVVVKSPISEVTKSDGVLVDLDPVVVEWSSSGKDELVSVFLENVDSGRRSKKKSVPSNVRSVTFDRDNMLEIVSERGYGKKNRVRAVVEWSADVSRSETRDVFVGIFVELLLYAKKIEGDRERTVHLLYATIDRSTGPLPTDYCFQGDFVGRGDSGPVVVPLRSCNDSGEVIIPGLDRVDWSKPLRFVYHGPDDPILVRSQVSGRPPSAVTLR